MAGKWTRIEDVFPIPASYVSLPEGTIGRLGLGGSRYFVNVRDASLWHLLASRASNLKGEISSRHSHCIPGSSFCVQNVCRNSPTKTYQEAEILHLWKIQVYT